MDGLHVCRSHGGLKDKKKKKDKNVKEVGQIYERQERKERWSLLQHKVEGNLNKEERRSRTLDLQGRVG